MKNNKVILAFSGGLDTTYCAIYLSKIKNLEVHAVTINTGGFSNEEIEKLEQHAFNLGVKSFRCFDQTESFYKNVIKYLIFGNILKNNTYPLSVSAERIVQAMAVAEYVKLIGASYVAHGSTGAGNDQVRFDMIFNTIIPEVEILTPIRDQKLSREDEIIFLKENGVKMDFAKAKYSINKGIWGTSVGGKETLTSNLSLPAEAFPTPATSKAAKKISIKFEKGEIVEVDEIRYENQTKAIEAIHKIASPYGIGRDIHVGDTIIGIKGRVGFEASAPLVIIKAHHALEKHVLTKWQLFLKTQQADWYGNWLHEGQFLDPVMRNIEAFLESTQTNVTGKVFIELLPYRFVILGIESDFDLMSNKFGSYGEMNNSWSGEDVKGFSKIFGNQTSMYHQINLTAHENFKN